MNVKTMVGAMAGALLQALSGGASGSAFGAESPAPYQEDEAVIEERSVCAIRLLTAQMLFKIGPLNLNLDYPMPAMLVDREAWQVMERVDRIYVLSSLQCILAGPGRAADIDIRARQGIDLLQRWRAGQLY